MNAERETVDLVKCVNCEKQSFVEFDCDDCPECGGHGCLMDIEQDVPREESHES